MNTFYVKMIDFDSAHKTSPEEIKYFNHDLYDIGHAISARVFNDNHGLLNQGQRNEYREVAFGIQELANLLMVCCAGQDKSLLTADNAFQHFMEIIKPIRTIDSIINNKIQHMQEVMEISENNQLSHPGFCVMDAENNVQSNSVISPPLITSDAKEFAPDPWLSIRRAIAKGTLPLIDIKPDTDLGDNIRPLGYAIIKKKMAYRPSINGFLYFQKTNIESANLSFNF